MPAGAESFRGDDLSKRALPLRGVHGRVDCHAENQFAPEAVGVDDVGIAGHVALQVTDHLMDSDDDVIAMRLKLDRPHLGIDISELPLPGQRSHVVASFVKVNLLASELYNKSRVVASP